nr:cytochrome c biogenesis factor N [Pellia epiphylla]
MGHYFLVLSISVALTSELRRPVAVSPYFLLFTMSFSGILFRYISSDFSNYNVFTNPNANAPLSYKISGTWSNHEGSPLLWCWIPSFYGFLFCCYPPGDISFSVGSLLDEQQIYKGIALFSSISSSASSNPFVRISFVRTKSLAESNPVSQDPILAIHPPCIYAGYVASAIGFCLCIRPYTPEKKPCWLRKGGPEKTNTGSSSSNATLFPTTVILTMFPSPRDSSVLPPFSSSNFGSLAQREEDHRAANIQVVRKTMMFHSGWTRRSANNTVWKQIQIWILTCWCFSTVGISLGSWWAHHELGWGGWWFRDPVENASSMPWVLATARIHSVILPKLNDWTSFLNMVTFLCCISGTFSVRSGLLASVHSFATDSTRGIFLWCFLSIITSISFLSFFGLIEALSNRLSGKEDNLQHSDS